MTTHKGVYYFPDYFAARVFAHANGLPTARIFGFVRGWAIQRERGGPYYGPEGWG